MKKFTWFLTLALVLVFAVSCGSSSKKDEKETPDTDTDEISDEEPAETDGDAEEPTADDSDKEPVEEPEKEPLKCEDFAEGLNENLIVGEGSNELARSFYLRLPENVDSMEKVPVIFIYHGYGDSAKKFRKIAFRPCKQRNNALHSRHSRIERRYLRIRSLQLSACRS